MCTKITIIYKTMQVAIFCQMLAISLSITFSKMHNLLTQSLVYYRLFYIQCTETVYVCKGTRRSRRRITIEEKILVRRESKKVTKVDVSKAQFYRLCVGIICLHFISESQVYTSSYLRVSSVCANILISLINVPSFAPQ